MTDLRETIIDWARQGRLRPEDLRRALLLEGALPSVADWRHFLDRLLLWLGTVGIAAGVIFFLAFNWERLGRFAKLGLVEALIVAALFFVGRLGLNKAAGKAALLASALLVGALLALIGQTYQTGADTFELFAVWAIAILPWVVIGRFPALWMGWLALVNLAVTLYLQTFPGLFGFLFDSEQMLWVLLGLNTVALAVWEGAAAAGVAWLRERWATRLLATAAGTLATVLAVFAVIEEASGWALLAWIVWLALAYAVYRHRLRNLFVLAGGVLSLIVVLTAFLGKHLIDIDDAGGFLLTGLVVIGLSAAGGWWLRRIAVEEAV
jgi:uncharacterized membrane protein